MKIAVNKIPEEGIEIHRSVNAVELDISPSDLTLADDVHIDAMVRRDGDTFFMDGTIKTVSILTCSRCGVEFSYPLDTFFHCHEEPISKTSTEIERALRKGDMDIDHYVGEEVEMNTLFREQVLLAVPMHPLCRPDCLGLCQQCGQNLNVKSCQCKQDEANNPFIIIKELLK